MSDLYIMFDEAYDAPANELKTRLQAIRDRWNLSFAEVVEAYFDYIDSDQFYYERGM